MSVELPTLEPYTPGDRDAWDAFVSGAKNGHFLFLRDYMEYHADRFVDASAIVRRRGRIEAVIPANVEEDALVSHGGLTFGGIVTDESMRTPRMLEVVDALIGYARTLGLGRVVYKSLPHIYHRLPAEEDLYALTRAGARLVRRDVSSAIRVGERPRVSKGRRHASRLAAAADVVVEETDDYETFMDIETSLLRTKYGVEPVHTAAELRLLAGRFPFNIRLFGAFHDGAMVGGVLVYDSGLVAHAQYISATELGKEVGALDAVIEWLLGEAFAGRRYFDFGISTEQSGRHLNVSLIENKEGFGGRAIVHDFYELPV